MNLPFSWCGMFVVEGECASVKIYQDEYRVQ